MDEELLDGALAYAERGWYVFPCRPRRKEPLTSHGVKDATRDPARIRAWWREHPGANIGLALEPSGLGAVDLDGPQGLASWAALAAEHDLDAETPASETGGGGRHLIYRVPPGVDFRNSVQVLGPKIDTRGAGGYIILPPSVHPNGRRYRWNAERDPARREPAVLPGVLLTLLHAGRNGDQAATAGCQLSVVSDQRLAGGHQPSATGHTPQAENNPPAEVLLRELRAVGEAQPGTRNDRLNQAAFRLGKLVGEGKLVAPAVFSQMLSRALAAGLGEVEARKTIGSGIGAGMAQTAGGEEECGEQEPGDGGQAAGVRGQESVISDQESGDGGQESVISDQPSVTSDQRSVISTQPPASSIELPASSIRPPSAISHPPSIKNYLPLPGGRDPTSFRTTDAGNAELFAALHGDRQRFDHRRKKWLKWAEHYWRLDDDGEAYRLALEAARVRGVAAHHPQRCDGAPPDDARRQIQAQWAHGSENAFRLRAALELAGYLPPLSVPGNCFDADPWLFACANGVIDLRTGALRPGRPEQHITLASPVAYDPAAVAPRWERFLREIFAGDESMVAFVQRAAGYSLTGDMREQVVFLCWGGGNNGKSKLLTALREACGAYAYNTPFATFELGRFGDTATNDLAALVGRRFVTSSETAEARRLNEARLKAITGGDPLTVRFLYGEFFSYQPMYKVWLAMNHKPVVTGSDEGIWRRLRLLPFTVCFKGREEKNLSETLAAELPGVLAWAVRGCLAWQREGLGEPPAVLSATEAYRAESDVLAGFLADCTHSQPAARVAASALYQAYESWCKANGERALGNRTFSQRMAERGIARERGRQGNYYAGLELG